MATWLLATGLAATAAAAITVRVSPARAAVTTSQSQPFAAVVTGDPQNLGVTWSVDGTNGGNPTSGTIDANGSFTPGTQIGVHTVTATSVADNTSSASATVAVTDLTGVFTYHNDKQRTGVNAQEYALSPAAVNPSNFGKLFSCPLDGPGYVYAQPLYVANLTLGDGKKHNVVYVATESDWVYAYDADSSSCQQIWRTRVLLAGEATVPAADTGTDDLVPEIGVTSTPVIDPATSTLYVCAKSKDANSNYHHRLYALDLVTGAAKLGSPIEIAAANFVPLRQLQRPGLLLNGGTLYLAFGSHGDTDPYQGWLIAYDTSPPTLTQKFAWSSVDATSGSNRGGIWGAGSGPAVDASGNLYVATGNGTFDANVGGINYGDSVVKLSPNGTVADYFAPSNQATLDATDLDLGSSGVIVLPDSLGSSNHLHLALAAGKPGLLYLLDRGALGGYHSGGPDQVVQEVAVHPNTTDLNGGVFGQAAVWGGNLYVTSVGDPLWQFTIANGAISAAAQSQSVNTFGLRGATPAVSSNGATNGIVWALDIGAYPSGPAVLNAYDATNLANRLFASPSSGSGAAGTAVKFTVPTVANGKVYVGGQASLTVFGYLPASLPPPPPGLVAAYGFEEGSGTTVTDLSGNHNTGTLNGATRTTAGHSGSALVFDGSTSRVDIPDSSSLDLTSAMTLEAWVYPTSLGNWRDLIYKVNDLYYLSGSSDQGAGVPAVGGTFSSANLYASSTLALNTWSHLAATYDGSTMRLFVNGGQVASRPQTGPIQTSTGPLTLGGDPIYGQNWAGRIDEVRVYSRVLSASEIQTDMNTPLPEPGGLSSLGAGALLLSVLGLRRARTGKYRHSACN